MCGQHYLADEKLKQLLEKVDEELAAAACARGCVRCGGKLHRANYLRKPRGLASALRHSFCCAVEGCRKRETPPSVRFMGRRVYAGIIVVLLSAMCHGLTPQRVAALRKELQIDRRTLTRWRWW